MGKRIIVLGGGTGGTLLANRLRRLLDRDADIVVIDSDDEHVYQPGLLFVPFGMAAPARLIRPRHGQLRPGITFRRALVDRVDISRDEVALADGTVLGGPRGSRRTCSSPSSASTPSTRSATSTSSWPPSATPACTWPPGPAACPACRLS